MPTNCFQCDHEVADDAQFCLNCGASAAGPGPDNIGFPDIGGTATPPRSPEPTAVWQPEQIAPPVAHAPAPAVGGPPPAGGPPAQPPYFDPSGRTPAGNGPQFVETGSSSSGGGAGRVAVAGLGVVGLAAVGFLALRFITGPNDVAGGASSPEAVVEEMVAAVNAQDPLAVVSLLAPDELDGLDDVVEEAGDYFNDLGLDQLIEDDAEESEIIVDIEADRIDVSMEGDNAAVVSFELSGELEVTGDLGEERVRFDSRDLEDALPNGGDEVEMILVKLDGKWFASPMLTAGHYIVENADLPGGEYDQIGGDRDPGAANAEDAVQALVDVINDPDADALAAALGGGEGRVATVFRDAIDEGFSEIDSDVSYDLKVTTEDIGNGRVRLAEIELDYDDDFDDFRLTIEDDCATVDTDGERGDRECLVDSLELDNASDIDTTLWLDTVEEDGGFRVRIVPTLTDVMGRFIGVIDDRQSLLYALDLQQFDEATTVSPGSDIEIEFDGQLYTVNEFEVEADEWYAVTASNDAFTDVWVEYDGGDAERQFGTSFEARDDGIARVVTYSETDFSDDCGGLLGCLPSGQGDTTLRIRQAARQSVPFPTIVSGELGPGDVRIFELDVDSSETVVITVDGAFVDWRILDDFEIFVDGDTYALTPGTYELVVHNLSGDDSTDYTVTPSPG